jgi:hypothetical protein
MKAGMAEITINEGLAWLKTLARLGYGTPGWYGNWYGHDEAHHHD